MECVASGGKGVLDKSDFGFGKGDNAVKKKLLVAMILFGVLFLSACSGTTQDTRNKAASYFAEEHQVKNYTDGEISAFGLNIAPADMMGDWVVDWLSNVSTGDGFQYFVYSDPDSWDVYLYYPNNHAKIPLLSNDDVKVDFSDSSLKIYVTESVGETTTDDTKDWILHFASYPRGAWPSSVELYWNTVEIPCDAISFK